MSATTPNFGIPYPTTDDQIRLIPDQLKTLATTVDNTMYGAGPRSGGDLASIGTNNATIGQQAYVYESDETKKAHAGPYWYYGRKWVRPAQAAVIVNLTANDDWAIETWQWQTFGQPYVAIRLVAKHDIAITEPKQWALGTFTQNEYIPQTFAHLPAFTNENHASVFGFQVGYTGLILRAATTTGFTFKAGNVVYSMLTWPCPNVGDVRKFTTS